MILLFTRTRLSACVRSVQVPHQTMLKPIAQSKVAGAVGRIPFPTAAAPKWGAGRGIPSVATVISSVLPMVDLIYRVCR